MATVNLLGPADHGRLMDYDEFMAAEYEPGFKYEIIDGRLYVSPLPRFAEHAVERWLLTKLDAYAQSRPDIINFVASKSRVFVSDRPGATVPEPDVAAFRDVPLDADPDLVHWEDLSPVIVAEVLTADDPYKDLVRNVELYLQAPSIKEYWIVDIRAGARHPNLIVYRRRGHRWQKPREYAYGTTYTTPLLPNFSLLIDPRT
jgi:Uma2 family endonuclease